MSTILDALKKLERDKEVDAAQSRPADPLAPAPAPVLAEAAGRRSRAVTGLVVGALLTFSAGIGFGLWTGMQDEAPPVRRDAATAVAPRPLARASSPTGADGVAPSTARSYEQRPESLAAPSIERAPGASATASVERAPASPSTASIDRQAVSPSTASIDRQAVSPSTASIDRQAASPSTASIDRPPVASARSVERPPVSAPLAAGPSRTASRSVTPPPSAAAVALLPDASKEIQAPVSAPVSTASVQAPVSAPVSTASVVPTPKQAPSVSVESSDVAVPEEPVHAGLADVIVGSEDDRREVTVLRTVWHPKPERRSAQIRFETGGEPIEVHEVEIVEGYRVESITPSAVVLVKDGVSMTHRVGR